MEQLKQVLEKLHANIITDIPIPAAYHQRFQILKFIATTSPRPRFKDFCVLKCEEQDKQLQRSKWVIIFVNERVAKRAETLLLEDNEDGSQVLNLQKMVRVGNILIVQLHAYAQMYLNQVVQRLRKKKLELVYVFFLDMDIKTTFTQLNALSETEIYFYIKWSDECTSIPVTEDGNLDIVRTIDYEPSVSKRIQKAKKFIQRLEAYIRSQEGEIENNQIAID